MDINSILQGLSPKDWSSILALLGSGTGVAIVLQIVKHYGKLAEAKKTVMALLGALSFLATYADWFIQYSNQNPKVVIGAHLGWVVTAAIFVHRFAVSPAYYKVTNWLNTIYSNAKAYEASAAAVVPASTESMAQAPQEFTLTS